MPGDLPLAVALAAVISHAYTTTIGIVVYRRWRDRDPLTPGRGLLCPRTLSHGDPLASLRICTGSYVF